MEEVKPNLEMLELFVRGIQELTLLPIAFSEVRDDVLPLHQEKSV